MAERKLATIRRVSQVDDIPNKDRIGLAHIDGWTVIVQKEQIHAGDLVVFCEIDSILPDAEWCSFLKDKRIKTMRMAKQLSQGIAFPLSILPAGTKAVEGMDVTEILGITKWERPDATDSIDELLSKKPSKKYPTWLLRLLRNPFFRGWLGKWLLPKKVRKGFPKFVSKTDEVRCLTGDTKIETAQGKIRIADIVNKHLDVLVKSYSYETEEVVWKPIVSWQKYPADGLVYDIEYTKDAYRTRKNRVECTADHYLLSSNGKYRRADEFKPGDSVWYSEECYPEEVIPAVYGMILGDGCVSVDRRKHKDGAASLKPRIGLTQGEDQLEYLRDKLSMFGIDKIRKGASGYGDGNIYQAVIAPDYTITKALSEDTIQTEHGFVITEEFCKKLTPLSLAIWYMDDGCIRHNNDDTFSPTIQISSNAFSYEENVLLSDMLTELYMIDNTIRTEHRGEKTYYSIYIKVASVRDFLNLVTPYMPECMRYKTIPELRSVPYIMKDIRFEKREKLIENKVTSVRVRSKSKYAHDSFVYDLEIADTHNFFANDILNHNCQNAPWYLDKDQQWCMTEKVDGQSGTFAVKRTNKMWGPKFETFVCSRNIRLSKPDNSSYWRVWKKYGLEQILISLCNSLQSDWVCIQGEVIGPGIQGNKYKRTEPELYVFNFISSRDGRWASADGKLLLEPLGLTWVPIIGTGYLPKTVEEMLTLAHGPSRLADINREGLVCRSLDGTQSFKAVDPDFLIHYGE